jgi:AbrB family looped-hinge helix DNA binding protein
MEVVTISSKGQIAIPKAVRDAMGLSEGTRLNLDVRDGQIVLSKGRDWRSLRGAGSGVPGLMEAFAVQRKAERELEDTRP